MNVNELISAAQARNASKTEEEEKATVTPSASVVKTEAKPKASPKDPTKLLNIVQSAAAAGPVGSQAFEEDSGFINPGSSTVSQELAIQQQGLGESPDDIFQGTEAGDPPTEERRRMNLEVESAINVVRKAEVAFNERLTFSQQFEGAAKIGTDGRNIGSSLGEIARIRREQDAIKGTLTPNPDNFIEFGNRPLDAKPELREKLKVLDELLLQAQGQLTENIKESQNQTVTGLGSEEGTFGTRPALQAAIQANEDGKPEVRDALLIEFFPEIASQITLSSLTQQGFLPFVTPFLGAAAAKVVLGTTKAVVTGFVVGTGVSSFGVEEKAAFVEYFQEAGVNLGDPKAVEEAFADPEFIKAGRLFALKAGVGVSVWEMASAFLAGKTPVPSGILGKWTTSSLNIIAQGTQSAVTAGLGEITKQKLQGKDINTLEVELEIAGEFVTGPFESAVIALADKLGAKPKDFVFVHEQLNAFLKSTNGTIAELAVSLEETLKDGTTKEAILNILNQMPGIPPTILRNTHVNSGQRVDLKVGKPLRNEMEDLIYVDTKGNERQGVDILNDSAPSKPGTIYWSTPYRAKTSLLPGEVSGSIQILQEAQENVANLQKNVNIMKGNSNVDIVTLETAEEILAAGEERLAVLEKTINEMNEVRPLIQDLLSEMSRIFFPGQDIMVIEDNATVEQVKEKSFGSAGVVDIGGRKVTLITMNTKRLLDLHKTGSSKRLQEGTFAPSFLSVVAHEMGHTLQQQLINSLPPKLLDALHTLHRNYLAEALRDVDAPMAQILKARMAPFLFEDLFSNTPGTLRGKLKQANERDILGQLTEHALDVREQLEYNFSFNEFIADMMARQLGLEGGPVDVIMEKVLASAEAKSVTDTQQAKVGFSRIMGLLRKFHAKHISDKQPAETYAKFLQLLKLRQEAESIKVFNDSFSEVEQNLPAGNGFETLFSVIESKQLDLPEAVRDQIEKSVDTYNGLMGVLVTLLQLGKENPHIKGLRDYITSVHGHAVTKANWNDRAMQTINQWRKLGKIGDHLGKFLLELTRASDKLERKLTNDEMADLVEDKKIDVGKNPKEFWDTFKSVEADLNAVLENMYILEQNRLATQLVDQQALLKGKMQELNTLFDKLRDRNYFPLSRFGKFGIKLIVKPGQSVEFNGKTFVAGQTVTMELYETKSLRNKGIGTLQRAIGPGVRSEFIVIDEDLKPFTGLPSEIFLSLKDNPSLGLTLAQKKVLQDMIDARSPTRGIAKRMLERKGTAGFSRDALRGYGNYMLEAGSHIARMQHRVKIDAAIDEVTASSERLGKQGIINDKRAAIAKHLIKHRDYLFNPASEWTVLRALAFIWHLGYVVKSAAVNLTQVPFVAYPYLASRSALTGGITGQNDALAIQALSVAGKDIRWSFERNRHNFTVGEQEMFSALQAEGLIDESLATDVVGLAHGDMLSKMMPAESGFTDAIRQGGNTLKNGSVKMFQTAEKFNRRLVGLATYRLAIKAGMPPPVAIAEAREAIRTTQFEYARWNRAAFMRGKAGVLTVFMQYMQNSAYFVARDPGKFRYMMMMLAFGGVQGIFGMEDLLAGIDWGRRLAARGTLKGDPRKDTREDMRSLAIGLDLNPELIMHGLASMSMGLSLPVVSEMTGITLPGISLESSISQGSVVPALKELLSPNRLSGAGVEAGGKDALGAALTIPLNIMSWARDPDPDKLRSFERMAPAVLKGPARTIRMARDGGLDTRDGKQIIDFDATNPAHIMEAGFMFFGFAPTRLLREQERLFTLREGEIFYAQYRQTIMGNFAYAFAHNDTDGMKRIRREVTNFNKYAPRGQQITNLGDALVNRAVRRAKGIKGAAERTLDTPFERRVNETFPAAIAERIK